IVKSMMLAFGTEPKLSSQVDNRDTQCPLITLIKLRCGSKEPITRCLGAARPWKLRRVTGCNYCLFKNQGILWLCHGLLDGIHHLLVFFVRTDAYKEERTWRTL